MNNNFTINKFALKFIILIVVIFSTFLYSCSDNYTTEPPGFDYSDDRGISLFSSASNLIWSKDGNEVFVIYSGVRAVNISTKSHRMLDNRQVQYWGLLLSEDGNSLYYASSIDINGQNVGLYRVSVNSPQSKRIINSIEVSGDEPSLALSPDNIHLAYSKVDSSTLSMFYYNILDSSVIYLGNGRPVAFSPDGTQLLYSQNAGYFILTLSNNNVQSIGQAMGKIIWKSTGIFAFYVSYESSPYKYFVRDLITNATTLLWQTENMNDGWLNKWSPDGNKTAVWTGKCIKYESLPSWDCEVYQSDLNVIDVNSHTGNRIAYGKLTGNYRGGKIAFSRDNSKIAYVLGDNLYMKYIN